MTDKQDVLAEALAAAYDDAMEDHCDDYPHVAVDQLRQQLAAHNAQLVVWRDIAEMSDKYKDGRDVQLYCADTKEQFCAYWLTSLEEGDGQWIFARKIGSHPIAFIVGKPTHFAIIEPPTTSKEK